MQYSNASSALSGCQLAGKLWALLSNTDSKISHSLLIRQAPKVDSKKSKGYDSKLDLASNCSQPQSGFPDVALSSEATWVTQLLNSPEQIPGKMAFS